MRLSGERVAIFKYDGQVSAVSNLCQHQNSPLGEGRIRDGGITCPWHVVRHGALPTFRIDPATIRRLPPGDARTAVAP